MTSQQRTPGGVLQALRLAESANGQKAANEKRPVAGVRSSRVILVVDDSEPMREIMNEILGGEGHIVMCADHADMAKRIASYNTGIDLLITDVWMPGTNGMELAAWFQEQFPQTKRLYVSGDPNWLNERRKNPIPEHYLAKPFKAGEFLSKVREILTEEVPGSAVEE